MWTKRFINSVRIDESIHQLSIRHSTHPSLKQSIIQRVSSADCGYHGDRRDDGAGEVEGEGQQLVTQQAPVGVQQRLKQRSTSRCSEENGEEEVWFNDLPEWSESGDAHTAARST